MSKLHYFNQQHADVDDELLLGAIRQGLVPPGCLLGGATVVKIVQADAKPCSGCNGPRDRCGGFPKAKAGVGANPAELKRLHSLFTGAGLSGDPLSILRRKR